MLPLNRLQNGLRLGEQPVGDLRKQGGDMSQITRSSKRPLPHDEAGTRGGFLLKRGNTPPKSGNN